MYTLCIHHLYTMEPFKNYKKFMRVITSTILIFVIMIFIVIQNMDCRENDNGLRIKTNLGKTNHGVYTKALEESDGFFTDIREYDWKLMKKRQRASKFCYQDDCNKFLETPRRWYQIHFEPTFTCQHERRIGGLGDGPKWICDPHRIDKNDCLVYSIGSNNNFEFENSVLKDISENCEIHTFDPTVGTSPSRKPAAVHFHPWGLANESSGNMKTMQDIISILGHANRKIDIFKIDCEHCEWETFPTFVKFPNIRQIQIELHGTKKAEEFFRAMYKNNYVVFHKESNTYGCSGNCIEYAFIKLSDSFF